MPAVVADEQRFIVAISRVHNSITLQSATGVSRRCIATNKWLDSDIGDRATMSKPNVRIEDELAREMQTPTAGLDSLERAPLPSDIHRGRWRFLRCSKTLSWGQVLGTGFGFFGEALGASRRWCDGQKNQPSCRESALISAVAAPCS